MRAVAKARRAARWTARWRGRVGRAGGWWQGRGGQCLTRPGAGSVAAGSHTGCTETAADAGPAVRLSVHTRYVTCIDRFHAPGCHSDALGHSGEAGRGELPFSAGLSLSTCTSASCTQTPADRPDALQKNGRRLNRHAVGWHGAFSRRDIARRHPGTARDRRHAAFPASLLAPEPVYVSLATPAVQVQICRGLLHCA